jgi:hypothetical protein
VIIADVKPSHPTASLIIIARGDLPLLVPHSRAAAAGGGVEEADPVAGDLVALVVAEGEDEAVGALEFDVLARENEVGRQRRRPGGDGGGLGVDVDVDGVGGVVDGGGVGCGEGQLGPDERRNDALEQDVRVDQRDAAEGGVHGRLPEVVADDEHLQSVVGDCEFEEGAGPVLARGVGVLEQGGDGDVDGFGARVDERDHLLAGDLALDLVVDVRLVVAEDVEYGLVGDEVVGDVGLRLLVFEKGGPGVGDRSREALHVLWCGVCEREMEDGRLLASMALSPPCSCAGRRSWGRCRQSCIQMIWPRRRCSSTPRGSHTL